MTKFYPVGTIVPWPTETGEKLMVMESQDNKPICTGCFFTDLQRRKRGLGKFSCYMHQMACTPANRKDKKHVKFVAVKIEIQ